MKTWCLLLWLSVVFLVSLPAHGEDSAVAYNPQHQDETVVSVLEKGFEGLSIMPVSCVNYGNGHMVKYELFDTASSYECHFGESTTFVVSIAHYMRAYFNYEALRYGSNFVLPEDALYLNCRRVLLNSSSSSSSSSSSNKNRYLYAKIGCLERASFTSTTKLQLHLYFDAQCSQRFDDGRTPREHAMQGYHVGGYQLATHVSFKLPFYSCHTCTPPSIADTFDTYNNNWYDDAYIKQNGLKRTNDNRDQDDHYDQQQQQQQQDEQHTDDDDTWGGYMASNDDVNYDDAKFNDDRFNVNYYNYNGGGARSRQLLTPAQIALPHDLEQFRQEFSNNHHQRQLAQQNDDDATATHVTTWNLCTQLYQYSLWCNEDCRALDMFRNDEWSFADVLLLVVLCIFLSGMMLLVVAKRLKAQQKARLYGDDQPIPGLPPFGMALILAVVLTVICTMAKLQFVSETLVFAVVTCILLFIYMLKLTLFENRRPVLLAAPRHDMFDNPLNDHLFD